MNRRRYDRDPPTFAQTIAIIRTMPSPARQDLEAIKCRHLTLGFTYDNQQIHRALAVTTRRSN